MRRASVRTPVVQSTTAMPSLPPKTRWLTPSPRSTLLVSIPQVDEDSGQVESEYAAVRQARGLAAEQSSSTAASGSQLSFPRRNGAPAFPSPAPLGVVQAKPSRPLEYHESTVHSVAEAIAERNATNDRQVAEIAALKKKLAEAEAAVHHLQVLSLLGLQCFIRLFVSFCLGGRQPYSLKKHRLTPPSSLIKPSPTLITPSSHPRPLTRMTGAGGPS